MSTVAYDRQVSILDPITAAETHISILGCGTVGSWAATCLVKAGFKKLNLYDMDVVEDVNLPSQAFDKRSLGGNKAEELYRSLDHLGDDLELQTQTWALEGGEQFPTGVIICALDSMDLRKTMFELSAKGKRDTLWIDFRMGGNLLKVWAFDPTNNERVQQYLGTLHNAGESSPLPCGGRTFAPVGPLSGAYATQLVTKWGREDDMPPFHVMMDFDRFTSRAIGLIEKED